MSASATAEMPPATTAETSENEITVNSRWPSIADV
jgi:hypothetical protein